MTLLNGLLLILFYFLIRWIFRMVFTALIIKNVKKGIEKTLEPVKKLKAQDELTKSMVSDYKDLSEYATMLEDKNRQLWDFVDDVEYLAERHLASEDLRETLRQIREVKP